MLATAELDLSENLRALLRTTYRWRPTSTDPSAISWAASGSTLYYQTSGVVYRVVPGANNDVSMAADFDSSAGGALAARAAGTLYYVTGGMVYRMVPGAGNDVSMATDFDRPVSDLAVD